MLSVLVGDISPSKVWDMYQKGLVFFSLHRYSTKREQNYFHPRSFKSCECEMLLSAYNYKEGAERQLQPSLFFWVPLKYCCAFSQAVLKGLQQMWSRTLPSLTCYIITMLLFSTVCKTLLSVLTLKLAYQSAHRPRTIVRFLTVH